MCLCASCKHTDAFAHQGFAGWPRGNPTGPAGAKREYAAHVAYAWKDARKAAGLGPVGVAFYGGGKRAAEVLAKTFAPDQAEPEWLNFDWENFDPRNAVFPEILDPARAT